MGYAFTPFERKPEFWDGYTSSKAKRLLSQHSIMQNKKGFITGYTASGSGHAVAWNGEQVYDPVGLVYDYRHCRKYNFRPDTFHLLIFGIKVLRK